MSSKFTAELRNVEAFQRAVKLTNKATRDRMVSAIQRGTEAVVAGALTRVPRKSGELAWTLRAEYGKDGLVGYAKAGFGTLLRASRAKSAAGLAKFRAKREQQRVKRKAATSSRSALAAGDVGVYAPVVERGDPKRNHQAHPFMVPALLKARPAIIADTTRAMYDGIKDGGFDT